MAISVSCGCGKNYQLKEEFAGRSVTCPACGATLQAVAPQRMPQADPAFEHDKFLLKQKHLALNEKYHVWDEQGRELLFVERPVYLLKTLAAILAAVFVAIAGIGITIALGSVLLPAQADLRAAQGQLPAMRALLGIAVVVVFFVGSIIAALAVAVWIHPKRHVYFYRNESRGECLLQVMQDKKFWFLMASYSVVDASGALLARLHKNYLYNFIRKRWVCRRPDGTTLCLAQEDSIVLSLLRRFLGPMLGLLRTNFIITPGTSDEVIGEFNRKFTLLDRYVLDLTDDPARTLDRRIAVALGVMLDTGERR